MIDDEWDKQRSRAILVAFETGRPVFADIKGELRFADGDREPVPSDVGVPREALPQATTCSLSWWSRVRRWFGGRR